ncbi:MAG: hypothetical protein ABIQ86_08660 [Steroidobacteraceae bacterium]
MIIARPTVMQERWLAVGTRYPALRAAAEKLGHSGGWKTTTLLGRCLGFLLGLVGTGMLAGVLSQLESPLLVGGLVLVAAAEWLVAQRRVFRSGIEEAMYLCGAVAVVVQLLIWSDGNNDALGVALVATAVLLVGWRLLNPLFTTLAFAGYSLAIALSGPQGFGGSLSTLEAGIACVVLAIVALVAGGREWQRPAHDGMLDALVITMPWLAHGWFAAYGWPGSAPNNWALLVLALGFLAVNLVIGVSRSQHAPLIGALGNVTCAAYSLQKLLPWPLHWQLIAAGALLLAVAITLERLLRDRSEGLTSRAIAEPAGVEVIQLAGAASISPAPSAEPQPGFRGEGGGFGGGGASGRY